MKKVIIPLLQAFLIVTTIICTSAIIVTIGYSDVLSYTIKVILIVFSLLSMFPAFNQIDRL